jgi:hypothetical protein
MTNPPPDPRSVPSDVADALSLLADFDPVLVQGVIKELERRIGVSADPEVQLARIHLTEVLGKQELIRTLISYGVLWFLGIGVLTVSGMLVLREHPTQAAAVMAGFAAIIVAILNPFAKPSSRISKGSDGEANGS